jgi:hypothetical protein
MTCASFTDYSTQIVENGFTIILKIRKFIYSQKNPKFNLLIVRRNQIRKFLELLHL